MSTSQSILYNWKIGGEAGYGIMNTGGPIFAKTLVRAGFFVFIYSEYPSLIRGGHNSMQVAINTGPVNGAYREISQLVALNAHTIVVHQAELKPGGVVLYDSNMIKMIDDRYIDNSRIPPLTGTHTVQEAQAKIELREDLKYIPIALGDIAEAISGNKIMRNVVAVGASLAIFEREIKKLKLEIGGRDILTIGDQVLSDVFKKKSDAVIQANQKVLEAGYRAIQN